MSFSTRACWVLAFLLGACGGKVNTSSTGTGDGTPGGTNPTGTFPGGDMGVGSDPGSGDPGQSTPGNPAGGMGGTLSPGTPTCPEVCTHIAEGGCMLPDCEKQCLGAVLASPGCGPELDAVLNCFAKAPIGCQANGGVKFYGCDPYRDALDQCIKRTTPGDPGEPPMTIPAQCAGAPLPPSGMMCSGGGSGGGTGGTGGNAPPSCFGMCTDATGSVWSSSCVGENCTCMYNGRAYCSCVSATPCSSCCPGGI